MRTVYNTLQ